MEYSVGTICTIRQTAPSTRFVGAECVITEGLAMRPTQSFPSGLECYHVFVQGQGDEQYAARHEELIPKWIPPTSEFTSFMDKVLSPVSVNAEEGV